MQRLGKSAIPLVLALTCVGCATTGQTAEDLNAALGWFVPPDQVSRWPHAAEGEPLRRPPAVIVAWGPYPPPSTNADATPLPPKVDRERWVAAIQGKLARSGVVASAAGTPPNTFDGGVMLEGLQAMVRDRPTDLVVLFSLEVAERRYHVSAPSGATVFVASVIEVSATARAIGLTPAGRPVFAETRTGFDEGSTHRYSEVKEAAERAAVDALADAVVRRLDLTAKGRRS
jgi:hypothetical protein